MLIEYNIVFNIDIISNKNKNLVEQPHTSIESLVDDELDEEEEEEEELDMEGFAVLLGTAGGSSFGLNTFK